MKLIIPTTITDAMLTSTNVDETISTVWSGATTYAAGAFVYILTGTRRDIYESLQAGNLNKAPATETDWWVFRSITYTEWLVGSTYALADKVIDATNHIVYESLQAANTGNALTDTAWWENKGSTEPWEPFDEKVGSQVERTGTIYYELTPGIIEGIAFFNMDAESIDVVMTDPVEGEVFNETIDLISTSNVFDGYSYCFAPFLITKAAVLTDLPPYSSATLEITINAETNSTTAKCGEIVVGRVREFGDTQYGAGFEIIDFSTKSVDDDGNFSVTERPFSKRISMDVMVDNSVVGFLKQTLEDYRATPVVCIPTEVTNLTGPLLTYGYYRTARTVVPYIENSILTIEWEGLT